MEKKLSVSIIGLGGRGGDTYGNLVNKDKDHFVINSLCDVKQSKLDRFGREFGVEENNLFDNEDDFFAKRRSDILIIATQDHDHVRHMMKAMPLGYDILLEKPITDKKSECNKLLRMQKKYGNKVLVCHVLRYAPAFVKAKEMLDSGIIGKLILINALERVTYWHQAHSYVRGNWRRREDCTPMIMAKCCHDLDLLQYYAGSECESVSSYGDLTYFKKENAPDGCADRCVDCKYQDTCPYSAKDNYVKRFEFSGSPADMWPYNIIADAPLTKEKLMKAITDGPYGKCVFKCDNDVVDNQIVNMQFTNGVRATLTMTAFTKDMGRRMVFFGTKGQLILDEVEDTIVYKPFDYTKENTVIDLSKVTDNGYGHGGGDYQLVKDLYDIVLGNKEQTTSLAHSVESHLMGICAEKSRLHKGKSVKVH